MYAQPRPRKPVSRKNLVDPEEANFAQESLTGTTFESFSEESSFETSRRNAKCQQTEKLLWYEAVQEATAMVFDADGTSISPIHRISE